VKIVDCRTLSQICELMLDGEPCFLIRAQDTVSVKSLMAYIQYGESVGANNLTRAREVLHRFEDWQKSNPHRVKKAD
jgi:hypothetical protein